MGTVSAMKGKKLIRIALLCVAGLLLNIGGSWITALLGIPFYLDTIGTIFTAILGGYIPGILVALVSHFIEAFSIPSAVYYTSLSVIIAVTAASFSQRGAFNKIQGTILFTVLTAVTAGGLGSVLTWFIFGFSEDKIYIPFVRNLYASGRLSPFASQLISDLMLDLADKIINMIIIIPTVHLLPKTLKKKLFMEGWQQAPLSERERKAIIRSNTRKMSIRMKLLLFITIALLASSVTVTGISFHLYKKAVIAEHTRYTVDLAKLVASVIDPEKIDEYIENGTAVEGYNETKALLEKIQDGTTDVEFIYVYKVLRDGCHVVFDLDTEGLAGDEPGVLVVLDRSFADEIDLFLSGSDIEPKLTDDSYGWLLTDYEPIRDKDGVTQAYVAVDVTVDRVRDECLAFLTKQITLFLGILILLLVAGLWMAEYGIVLPVNAMSMAAGAFAYNLEESSEMSVDRIRDLNVTTGDEIENLYHVLEKMTEDSVKYVDEIKDGQKKIRELKKKDEI